jgi:hypothetical protein
MASGEKAWLLATPFFLPCADSRDPAIGAGPRRIHLGHRETVDALTTTVQDAQIPEELSKIPASDAWGLH